MIQKKVLIRTLSGVLVGGMMLTFGGFALAANDKNTDPNGLAEKFAPFGKFMKQNRGMHKVGFKGLGQETLNLLVKEGTLTQGKADEIEAFLDKKVVERKAQMEEFQKLSPEERKAQFEQKGPAMTLRTDLFSELVANKILTQEEADAIKAKLQEQGKFLGKMMFEQKGPMGGRR